MKTRSSTYKKTKNLNNPETGLKGEDPLKIDFEKIDCEIHYSDSDYVSRCKNKSVKLTVAKSTINFYY